MRLALITLVLSLALTAVACKSVTPVSQADMEAMQAAGQTFTAASIKASAEGNDATALMLAGMAGVTSILTTVGLSRRRRTGAALEKATGSSQVPSLQPSHGTG